APGHPVHAGGHAHRAGGRAAAHAARRFPEGCRPPPFARVEHGKAVRQRGRQPRRRQGRADPRRNGLLEGARRRAPLPRRAHHRNLRGDIRNPADGDLERDLEVAATRAWGAQMVIQGAVPKDGWGTGADMSEHLTPRQTFCAPLLSALLFGGGNAGISDIYVHIRDIVPLSARDWESNPLERRLVRDTARNYAQKTLAPLAARLDREGRFPRQQIAELAELGMMGVNIPEEYGGAHAGAVAYALAMMEIAQGCASTAVTMAVNNLV